MELDEILSSREKINIQLRDVLDEATDKWGVKIEAVEIREVDPATKVKDSMEEQTSAERRRRAAILAADGEKRAAILEAEGKRQSMILEAEGKRQSMVLEAEGKRLATILESQGEAQKLRILSVGASAMDSKALSVMSMDTLKSIGDGQASKIFFPIEVTKIVEGLSQYMGTGAAIPDREVANIADIEAAVGKADDVLGPIPSPAEIRAQIDEVDRKIDTEKKESETVVEESQ